MKEALIILFIIALAACGQGYSVTDAGWAKRNLNGLIGAESNNLNKLRAKHGLDSLVLARQLITVAQAYADKLCNEHNGIHHSHAKIFGKPMGENLAWAWGSPTLTYQSGQVTDSWYSEIKNYDFNTGESSNGGVIGHFTAMIWKTVQYVGFGFCTVEEDGGFALYSVANFYPAPNWVGQYVQNVPSPIN